MSLDVSDQFLEELVATFMPNLDSYLTESTQIIRGKLEANLRNLLTKEFLHKASTGRDEVQEKRDIKESSVLQEKNNSLMEELRILKEEYGSLIDVHTRLLEKAKKLLQENNELKIMGLTSSGKSDIKTRYQTINDMVGEPGDDDMSSYKEAYENLKVDLESLRIILDRLTNELVSQKQICIDKETQLSTITSELKAVKQANINTQRAGSDLLFLRNELLDALLSMTQKITTATTDISKLDNGELGAIFTFKNIETVMDQCWHFFSKLKKSVLKDITSYGMTLKEFQILNTEIAIANGMPSFGLLEKAQSLKGKLEMLVELQEQLSELNEDNIEANETSENQHTCYEILGIERTATQTEIRKAYRKKAKETHPDFNPDDLEAPQKFKMVQEAYDVLSDTAKKKQYDELLNQI